MLLVHDVPPTTDFKAFVPIGKKVKTYQGLTSIDFKGFRVVSETDSQIKANLFNGFDEENRFDYYKVSINEDMGFELPGDDSGALYKGWVDAGIHDSIDRNELLSLGLILSHSSLTWITIDKRRRWFDPETAWRLTRLESELHGRRLLIGDRFEIVKEIARIKGLTTDQVMHDEFPFGMI